MSNVPKMENAAMTFGGVGKGGAEVWLKKS